MPYGKWKFYLLLENETWANRLNVIRMLQLNASFSV